MDFSFNASLEPQLKAQKRARLAEDALTHNAGQKGVLREATTSRERDLVWFGGPFRPRSLNDQPTNQPTNQRFSFWTGRNIPRIPDPILGPRVRLNAGWSLADDIEVLRPGCPLGDGDPPDPFVLVDAYFIC